MRGGMCWFSLQGSAGSSAWEAQFSRKIVPNCDLVHFAGAQRVIKRCIWSLTGIRSCRHPDPKLEFDLIIDTLF